MTLRLAALLLLLYVFGFVAFATSLGSPAANDRTDAIVVLTGASGRIDRGLEVMQQGLAKRMFIAGVDPAVTRADLVREVDPANRKTLRCCVDLGSESVDTRSNAEETRRWIDGRDYASVRLVTSDWHMRRAAWELRSELPQLRILEDPVPTRPSLFMLFAEYNKYLLRRAALWLDV